MEEAKCERCDNKALTGARLKLCMGCYDKRRMRQQNDRTARKCRECGNVLGLYVSGSICSGCVEKIQDAEAQRELPERVDNLEARLRAIEERLGIVL